MQGQRLKNMGMRRGCPDFLIFSRPPVAIEMKRLKGSRVAPEQREFLEELSRHGWRCFVTYGHGAAIVALKAAGHLAVGELKDDDRNTRYEEISYLDEKART